MYRALFDMQLIYSYLTLESYFLVSFLFVVVVLVDGTLTPSITFLAILPYFLATDRTLFDFGCMRRKLDYIRNFSVHLV